MIKILLKPIDWIIKKLDKDVEHVGNVDVKNLSEKQIDLHYEQRIKFRDKILDMSIEAFNAYDKFLITIASSAMAISLTFTKNIVPFETAVYVMFFICSLVSFIFVILLCLTNVLKSGFATRKLYTELCTNLDYVHKNNNSVMRVNVVMGVFLVLGFLFMSMYVTVNVYKSVDYGLIKGVEMPKLNYTKKDTTMSDDVNNNRPSAEQLRKLKNTSVIKKSIVPASPVNTVGVKPQQIVVPTVAPKKSK